MTEKTRKIYRVYLSLTLLLAALLTVLRSLAILNHYDAAIGYFDGESLLSTLANVLTLLAVPFCLSIPFVLGGGKLGQEARRFHLPTVFTAALTAFLLIAFASLRLTEIATEILADAPTNPRVVFTSAGAALLSVFGAISFILTASLSAEVSAKKAFSTSAVVLFALCYAMFLYFESDLPLNAPQKLLTQVTMLVLAVFFLYETRVALACPMPAVRAAFGMLAMILTASASIPNLIYYLSSHSAVLWTPVHDFLLFAFFLYLTSRLTALAISGGRVIDPFFSSALASDEESVASVGQISFFNDDPNPAPITSAAAATLLASQGETIDDAESEEARTLFGAPEEESKGKDEDERDMIDRITDDLLGPLS